MGRVHKLHLFRRSLLAAAAACAFYYEAGRLIPEQVNLVQGQEEQIQFSLLFPATLELEEQGPRFLPLSERLEEAAVENQSDIPSNKIHITGKQTVGILGTEKGSYRMQVRLFGLVKLKEVAVDVVDKGYAIPCGTPVGIYLKSDGVLVIGTGTLTGIDGVEVEPAYGVLRSGDYIEAVNGKALSRKEELVEAVNQSGSNPVSLLIRRGGQQMTIAMHPVPDSDGGYKLGAWVRDDTQGIGTMTYLDMNGQFGALGHGISDTDTGELMSIQDGALYDTRIMGLEKGESGSPGVMSGIIYYGPGSLLGSIDANRETGIFGTAGTRLFNQLQADAIPVGFRQDVACGPALLRSSVSGEVKDYQIQITKVDYSTAHLTKSLVFEVTDPELLNLTGGIIQGMSGSPIIQDGKLVAAVTHVFVNEPRKGYGIFVETMMEQK